MILSIPYQAFEVDRVHLTDFKYNHYGKTIAQFTYKDHSIDLNDVSLLSPPMKVIDYNADNSRLRLDLSEHTGFYDKICLLYENLIHTIYNYQSHFLHQSQYTLEHIRHLFYYLLDGSMLSLYIYPSSMVRCANGTKKRMSEIVSGDTIRCVIRLHGVAQIMSKEGVKMRLHHTIPAIWHL
jgi:hypothetical protein